MYWSSALDSSRGRAVNPVTKEEYFRLLKEVIEEYNIPDELVYGADETGIQVGIGVTERVIGPAGASIQHQQRSGARENITVLPTICADGTTLAPTSFTREKLSKRSGCRTIPWTQEWDTRRRVTRQGRLVLRGSKTGINRPRQRQTDEHDCFLLTATVHIIHWGSSSMHTIITLLCCVILHIRPMSIKGSTLSFSVF
ncbi:hypothetical protein BGY98DRAFT_1117181 [Russula aff. rugulosa BPL654]|nr:hypothetical protein BGY98DRAFT_1117181 [Russula aff. rugulosa BPL654]